MTDGLGKGMKRPRGAGTLRRVENRTVKTRLRAGVACGTAWEHPVKQRVRIAVIRDRDYFLRASGLLALMPERLARAAVEIRRTLFKRALKRLAICIGERQHVVRARVHHDDRQQPVAVPFQCVEIHGLTGIPRALKASFKCGIASSPK